MPTEQNVQFSRAATFDLITPVEKLYLRDIASNLTDADQDLIREGYWLKEVADTGARDGHLDLIAAADTTSLASGNWRCVFVDGDRNDVAWSTKLTVIDGFGWRARTSVFVAASIVAGSLLTVVEGTDATGNYGHLKLAETGDRVVARAVTISTTGAGAGASSWLEFVALPDTFLAP